MIKGIELANISFCEFCDTVHAIVWLLFFLVQNFLKNRGHKNVLLGNSPQKNKSNYSLCNIALAFSIARFLLETKCPKAWLLRQLQTSFYT